MASATLLKLSNGMSFHCRTSRTVFSVSLRTGRTLNLSYSAIPCREHRQALHANSSHGNRGVVRAGNQNDFHREQLADEDHSITQVTVMLGCGMLLLCIPWAVQHPSSLLIPLSLFLIPATGNVVRPLVLEAISDLARGARWFDRNTQNNRTTSSSATPASPSANINAKGFSQAGPVKDFQHLQKSHHPSRSITHKEQSNLQQYNQQRANQSPPDQIAGSSFEEIYPGDFLHNRVPIWERTDGNMDTIDLDPSHQTVSHDSPIYNYTCQAAAVRGEGSPSNSQPAPAPATHAPPRSPRMQSQAFDVDLDFEADSPASQPTSTGLGAQQNGPRSLYYLRRTVAMDGPQHLA
jgi:hypothetical protein